MIWKGILCASYHSSPHRIPQLPCKHFIFILFIICKNWFTIYTFVFLILIHCFHLYCPLLSTSITDSKTHKLLASPSFGHCLSVSFFNFFLLFMFYFPGIYLYCVHVCVLPNRAVKIYCVSVFLRRLSFQASFR